MPRLKYPIDVMITPNVTLTIPALIEYEYKQTIQETASANVYVEIKYNSFTITTFIDKDNKIL